MRTERGLKLWLVLLWAVSAACSSEVRIEPRSGPQGATGLPIEVQADGVEFGRGKVDLEFPGSGITVSELEVLSSTKARALIDIPSDEPVGAVDGVVTAGSSRFHVTLQVMPGPQVSATPNRVRAGAGPVAIALAGTHTHFSGPDVEVSAQVPGLSIQDLSVQSDEAMTVALDVGGDAAPGLYDCGLRVWTDWQYLCIGLEVAGEQAAALTVEPAQVVAGTERDLEAMADRDTFGDLAEVWLEDASGSRASELVVGDPVVMSARRLRFHLVAKATAAPGRYALVVDSGGLVARGQIEVLAGGGVLAGRLEPCCLVEGTAASFRLHAAGAHFEPGRTEVAGGTIPAGLSVRLQEVVTPEEVALEISSDASCPLGEQVLRVETGPEVVETVLWISPAPGTLRVSVWPDRVEQAQAAQVTLTCQGCHFDETTELIMDQDIQVESLAIRGPESARALLEVGRAAAVGGHVLTLRTASRMEEATGLLLVDPAPLGVLLEPSTVDVGVHGARVLALAVGTEFSPNGRVTEEAGCGLLIEEAEPVAGSATRLALVVTAPLASAGRACRLAFDTEGGTLDATLTVRDTLQDLDCPGDITVSVEDGRQTFVRIGLPPGQVVRLRATARPAVMVDPVVELLASDGRTALAESTSEESRLFRSVLVWPSDAGDGRFVSLRDAFWSGAGDVDLSCALWEPEQETEDPNATGSQGGQQVQGWVVRAFLGGGEQDAYDLSSLLCNGGPDGWVLSILSARVLSGDAGVTAELGVRSLTGQVTWYGPGQGPGFEQDPQVAVWCGSGTWARQVVVRSESGGSGAYWFTARPWAVINEVSHDEADDWQGGYVELLGVAGQALDGCELVGGKQEGGQEVESFRIALDGMNFGSTSYVLLCHDGASLGCGTDEVDPRLAVSDPAGTATSVGVALFCNGLLVDGVCWRGSGLAWCEGSPAPTWDSGLIGRMWGMDRQDNGLDFVEQWQATAGRANSRNVE